MRRRDKVLEQILRGTSDANISFDEMCRLLQKFGFEMRVRGDHHIFTKEGVEEILNLQPKVKQVRAVILKYKLGGDGDV